MQTLQQEYNIKSQQKISIDEDLQVSQILNKLKKKNGGKDNSVICVSNSI